MSDKNLTIGINVTGADNAAREIKKVSFSQETQISNIKAMSDKARVAEFAFYDLDREMAKTGNTIERVAAGPITTLATKAKAAQDPMRGIGMMATQVGYQVTDFATQVQMGTSAITAFSMQAPQAIGAMQMMGGSGASLSTIMKGAVSAGTGVSLVLTELVIGGKMVYDAWKEMSKVVEENSREWYRAAEATAYAMTKEKEYFEAVKASAVARLLYEQTLEAKALGDQLDSNLRILESTHNLESAREKRAGATKGEQAENQAARVAQEQSGKEGIARAAQAEAHRLYSESVAAYNSATDVGGKLEEGKAVDEAKAAADAADLKVSTIMKIGADTVTDAVESAVEAQNAEFVAGMNETVAGINANTPETQAAKAAVQTALSDGKITAAETRAMADGMRTLMGGIQSGNATVNGNVTEMLRLMGSYQSAMNSHTSTIYQLQTGADAMLKRINDLERRIP